MKKKIYFFLAETIGPVFLKILFKTVKIKVLRREIIEKFISGRENFILVFWHGKMVLPVLYHKDFNMTALVSQHSDGEIIARIMRKLGYNLIRGSSTRGGTKAFRQMVRLLKNGGKIVITPDGPIGPAKKVKEGTAMLAKITETPVIPVSFSCSRKKVFKSWDEFILIKPFSTVIMAYAEPVYIEGECSLEKKIEEIERKLINLDEETTKMVADFFSTVQE